MKAIKRLQKGVMIIEVVAVLGLLAAITPMLFQQISRRNDEILNVQVATEMRAIKDAHPPLFKPTNQPSPMGVDRTD